MSFKEPTYEEYQKANAWAKFKYKYGIIVLILCWLSLFFLIYYMVSNIEAIESNPFTYGAEKYNVTCECRNLNENLVFYFNSSNLWVANKNNFRGVPYINIDL